MFHMLRNSTQLTPIGYQFIPCQKSKTCPEMALSGLGQILRPRLVFVAVSSSLISSLMSGASLSPSTSARVDARHHLPPLRHTREGSCAHGAKTCPPPQVWPPPQASPQPPHTQHRLIEQLSETRCGAKTIQPEEGLLQQLAPGRALW